MKIRQFALISLLCVLALPAFSERWYVEDMLFEADYELWQSLSKGERELVILGFVLGNEGLRSEFADDRELYRELGKFSVDLDEYMGWIKSHVNEVYRYHHMRDLPLGVALQLRHKLIKDLRGN